MSTWVSDVPPPEARPGAAGWALALSRGLVLGLVIFGCFALLLALRFAVERPLYGQRRPVTPYITQFVCRAAFVILGIRRRVEGRPMRGAGAIVANHASWLDIFALNASDRVYFVSKSEVARWPGIGWLARGTGTLFIARDPREAGRQREMLTERLRLGHRLLFFPEGTSTDGLRVLPFKSTLFAAFYADGLAQALSVQPVSLRYEAPPGTDARFYGWWGDMGFGSHLLKVLARPRQGSVTIVFHPPLPVAEAGDRKRLCARSEALVRAGHAAPAARQSP
jgi:1-acyl-sn-glycerol-3-phosphate acyltransferase